MAPRRPKTATRRPKTRQDGPKMAPRCAQDGTRTVKRAMLKQVGFRMASERESIEKHMKNNVFRSAVRWLLGGQGGHKTPQDGHKTPQDAAKTSQDGSKMRPRRYQDGEGSHVEPRFFPLSLGGLWEAKTATRRPKTATRRPKTATRRAKMAPRCAQDAQEEPRCPKARPRWTKTAPRWPTIA